jgi:hypothetical protein
MKKGILILCTTVLLGCNNGNNDYEIKRLLNSDKPWDIIEGAWKAGESGEKKYVPLLLHDDGSPGGTTVLKFKGFTVYQEKMFALTKILHVKPPHKVIAVTSRPDSVNIKFYSAFWQNMNKKK